MNRIILGALLAAPIALVACKSDDAAQQNQANSSMTAGIPATGQVVLAVTGMT